MRAVLRARVCVRPPCGRLPWDLDGALGQDNGLGGLPGDAYCVLACEQWNSPLYCDR